MKDTKYILAIVWGLISCTLYAQTATIKEGMTEMKTYSFSDPNPIANPSNFYYPYFRSDGFSEKSVNKKWKTVELENDFIKLSIFPEIGGKIWSAIDKTNGKPFIYSNGVVKFRDISMRGPWTSGGIEMNYGIKGHTPTTSSPVDYYVQKKEDGSVSCYITSYDLFTQGIWTVEVNLPTDKAYFTTHTTWYNYSSINQPYYHWMNAGYPTGKNAELCFPGDFQIGHNGLPSKYPIDAQGRNYSWYKNNNYGVNKSFHVLGYYNDYFGIYYHDDDHGSVHFANFDDKMGMKIFMWSQARSGAIWENLLTDHDGQYIELQSGRVFNQPGRDSGVTPHKHPSFSPQLTEEWTEYWYPVKGIQGISKASSIGALHVTRSDKELKLAFSPLQKMSSCVKIYNDNKLVESLPLNTNVLEPVSLTSIAGRHVPEGLLKVVIGDDLLVYSEKPSDFDLNRPLRSPADFDHNSLYGLYVKGEQLLNQRVWDGAEEYLKKVLQKDKYYSPALVRLASIYYREGRYNEALSLLKTALSIDTYQADANYLYGMLNRTLGNVVEAKAAFSIAALSSGLCTAAYEQLGELYAAEKQWKKAEHYALKSLNYNQKNLRTRQLLMFIYRNTHKYEKAMEQINYVLSTVPLYHGARFEKLCLEGAHKKETEKEFLFLIRNEFPYETFIEMAEWYQGLEGIDEALQLLNFAKQHPLALYQKAYILDKKGEKENAKEVLNEANMLSTSFVSPYRHELFRYLEWAEQCADSWKIKYYKGLLYWANKQTDKALELLNQCNPSDCAEVYLSRAILKKGNETLKDLLMAESIQKSWRTGLALIDYFTSEKDWKRVVQIGSKYMKLYPDNYFIGLKYAQGLCENGQFSESLSLLKKMLVLPNEGAYVGRQVFRNCYLYQAIDKLKKKKYKSVHKLVSLSSEWLENLGVGKPYEDVLDERVEAFIEYQSYKESGDVEKAEIYKERLVAHKVDQTKFDSASLLQAIILREEGRTKEANRIVKYWKENYSENVFAQWATAVFEHNVAELDSLFNQCMHAKSIKDVAPWEKDPRDMNIQLVMRLFSK